MRWFRYIAAFTAVVVFSIVGNWLVHKADAHTPVATPTCDRLAVAADNYPATGNHVTVVIDAKTVVNMGFGSSYGGVWGWDRTKNHTWSVDVTAGDGFPEYKAGGTQTACSPSTTTPVVPNCPPNQPGPSCTIPTTVLPPPVQTNPATSVAQSPTTTVLDAAPGTTVSPSTSAPPAAAPTTVGRGAPPTTAVRSSLPVTGGDTWRGFAAGVVFIAAGGLAIVATRRRAS